MDERRTVLLCVSSPSVAVGTRRATSALACSKRVYAESKKAQGNLADLLGT